ncbi:MAG TPA: hypothetical protein VF756_28125 [Thermoanaerobaculia bacterium]
MSTETDIARIEEQLRALAAETLPPRPLPTAGAIWWRAEIIRKLTATQEAATRAAKPARWGGLAGLLAAVATPLLLLPLQDGPLGLPLLLGFALTVPPIAVLLALELLRQEA